MPIHEQKKFTGNQLEVKASGNEYICAVINDEKCEPGYNYVVTKAASGWEQFNPETIENVEEEAVSIVNNVGELSKTCALKSSLHVVSPAQEETKELTGLASENMTISAAGEGAAAWCIVLTTDKFWKECRLNPIGENCVLSYDSADLVRGVDWVSTGPNDNLIAVKVSVGTDPTKYSLVGRGEDAEVGVKMNMSNNTVLIVKPNEPAMVHYTKIVRDGSEKTEGDLYDWGAYFPDGPFAGLFIGAEDHGYQSHTFGFTAVCETEEFEIDPEDIELDDDRKTITIDASVSLPGDVVADYLAGQMVEEIGILANNGENPGPDKIYVKGLFYKHSIENWIDGLSIIQDNIQVK